MAKSHIKNPKHLNGSNLKSLASNVFTNDTDYDIKFSTKAEVKCVTCGNDNKPTNAVAYNGVYLYRCNNCTSLNPAFPK